MPSTTQLVLARTYGVITLLLSLGLIVFVTGECCGAIERQLEMTGLSFAGGALFALPFIIHYTSLGLNTAEGESPSPETMRRHDRLNAACPWWHLAWNTSLVVIVLSWILAIFVGLRIDVFVLFGAMLLMLTGIWFMTVFGKATEALSVPPNDRAEPGVGADSR